MKELFREIMGPERRNQRPLEPNEVACPYCNTACIKGKLALHAAFYHSCAEDNVFWNEVHTENEYGYNPVTEQDIL